MALVQRSPMALRVARGSILNRLTRGERSCYSCIGSYPYSALSLKQGVHHVDVAFR